MNVVVFLGYLMAMPVMPHLIFVVASLFQPLLLVVENVSFSYDFFGSANGFSDASPGNDVVSLEKSVKRIFLDSFKKVDEEFLSIARQRFVIPLEVLESCFTVVHR